MPSGRNIGLVLSGVGQSIADTILKQNLARQSSSEDLFNALAKLKVAQMFEEESPLYKAKVDYYGRRGGGGGSGSQGVFGKKADLISQAKYLQGVKDTEQSNKIRGAIPFLNLSEKQAPNLEDIQMDTVLKMADKELKPRLTPYKSIEDVLFAVQEGTIPQEEAMTILERDFGLSGSILDSILSQE